MLFVQSLLSACCWQILVKEPEARSKLNQRGVVYLQRDSPLQNSSSQLFQPKLDGGFTFDLEALREKLAGARDGQSVYSEVMKIFGTVVLCH